MTLPLTQDCSAITAQQCHPEFSLRSRQLSGEVA